MEKSMPHVKTKCLSQATELIEELGRESDFQLVPLLCEKKVWKVFAKWAKYFRSRKIFSK